MPARSTVRATVRSAARHLWRRLPEGVRHRIRPPQPRVEAAPSWYDDVYANSPEAYACHYTESPYYFVWTLIADRLRDARGVLEIGCGPGQLAHLLYDQGVKRYAGFDFSSQAVAMARTRVPAWSFHVDDARSSELYSKADYDTVICTEVLEHIEDDIAVLQRVPRGVRVISTVPNYDSASHVRYFSDAAQARARYAHLYADVRATTLPKSPTHRFFLLDGIRGE